MTQFKTMLALAGALVFLSQPGFAQPIDDAEQGTAMDPDPPVPAVLGAGGKGAVAGINAFSLDLYLRSRDGQKNLFLSPASVSTAVGFAYRGAKGMTAEELRRVMHFPADPMPYLRANGAVLATLNFSGPGRELKAANAIWTKVGMPIEPDYLAEMAAHAKSALNTADFAKDPEAARLTINRWVQDETHDRVRDLLDKDIITKMTGAVLVNALYWKGQWASPFAREETRDEAFKRLDGEVRPLALMHQRAHFKVLDRGGYAAVQLPYAGGEVAMVVILPDRANGLPAFEEKLTAATLVDLLGKLDQAKSRDTILTLPKLKLEWEADFAETLKDMGAPTVFSDAADFSGIAKLPYPGGDPSEIGLRIKHVVHKAVLEVDEAGSEAAAATAVVMDVIVTSACRNCPPPPPPFIFRADKPFMLLLRDTRTEAILFMGRYTGPPQ